MQVNMEQHWHHLPVRDVLELLDSNQSTGLDIFNIQIRQEEFGGNCLTPAKGQNPLIRFLLQFHQPLVYILIAATIVTFLIGEWLDSIVIFMVVLINSLIGYIQEDKSIKAIEALKKEMSYEARVLRSDKKKIISACELVPGDIVFLQPGDKVPADIRLLDTKELHIDESALTGESVSVTKQSGIIDRNVVLADRTNMAFSTTLVTRGMGCGVVTGIGDNTEIGYISEMIAAADILQTPLTRKIVKFSKLLLYVILFMAALTFIFGLFRGESWHSMFLASVAMAVGAIPEGLPATVTITLAIGVSRMCKRNAIIRKLPAVETLGSTTVICSDKTGTLTQNKMTVAKIVADNEYFRVSGTGYNPKGSFSIDDHEIHPQENSALLATLKAGLLCNDARLFESNGGWEINGDPTEAALLVSAAKAGLQAEDQDGAYRLLDTIPFESEHQYMAMLFEDITHNNCKIFVKGSVESILSRCSHQLDRNGDLGTLEPSEIEHQVNNLASHGLRILAFAQLDLPIKQSRITSNDIVHGLTFLGMQGMIDPPREEAVQSVRECQKAGIRVKMITGDHHGTAVSIARQMHLNNNESEPGVITGIELQAINDEQLIQIAEKTPVFARVAPEQKLRLVEALQSKGHVVAMTGDGVNDAPALRRADIGIAMGITGTEVSKEAADMVLTDDNFSSIQAAVEEGRGIFDNLIKFITWTLPTNLGEGLVIMAAIIFGITLPVLPVQILWVNMTTAIFLGLMLAFEPKEKDLMKRSPRSATDPILSHAMIFRIFLVGFLLLIGASGLFIFELNQGASVEKARTVAVNVFVFGELFYLFNCRSLTYSMFKIGVFSNFWLIIGVIVMTCLQLLYTYSDIMNKLFHSASLDINSWVRIITVSFIIYTVVGIEKWLRNLHNNIDDYK